MVHDVLVYVPNLLVAPILKRNLTGHEHTIEESNDEKGMTMSYLQPS